MEMMPEDGDNERKTGGDGKCRKDEWRQCGGRNERWRDGREERVLEKWRMETMSARQVEMASAEGMNEDNVEE